MVHSSSKSFQYKSYAQWIATAGALMLMLQTGIMVGWTSPNLARLTSDNSTIPLTLTQASWVAACLNLGRFVGAFLVPVFVDLIGSKSTVLFVFFPITVSWTLLIIANSVEWLYAARFAGGISFGLAYGCFSLYLGEVSLPGVRGTLISLATCGAPLGAVIGTVGESYLPMPISSSVYLVECLLAIVLFVWMPESPYHLVKKNKIDSARKSVAWYRNNFQVDQELSAIKSFIDANAGMSLKDKFREFKSPPIRRALILVIILYIFPQMCGLFNIMFYMEIILTKGKSFLIDPQQFVIYANIISVISTTLGMRLIDRLGRRFLLIISSVGTTAAMAGLGVHFYLLDSGIDVQNLQWVPIASILAFTVTFTIGFLTVPSTVLSEIFPANIKSIAACMSSLTSALFGFIASKAYQPMIDALGEAYVFWIHAGFAILAVPCALFLLPETKGKSFQQIQDLLYKT